MIPNIKKIEHVIIEALNELGADYIKKYSHISKELTIQEGFLNNGRKAQIKIIVTADKDDFENVIHVPQFNDTAQDDSLLIGLEPDSDKWTLEEIFTLTDRFDHDMQDHEYKEFVIDFLKDIQAKRKSK